MFRSDLGCGRSRPGFPGSRVVLGGERSHLDEVTGEPHVACVSEFNGPFGEYVRATGQCGHFQRDLSVPSRFEGGRIAVEPTTVEAPDVVHDELGFVINGL